VQPVTTVEQLRQELEQMKQERDDAVQRADAAEAAAQSWGESLNAEAAHLRRLCSTMAQDQSAVSGQVSDLSARRQQADSLEEGDAIVDPHEELSALPRDITDLTVELSELRAQRTSLQARVSTLRQELEAQLAEEAEFCRLLHEAKGRNQAPSTTDGDDEEAFDIEFLYEGGFELCNRKSAPSTANNALQHAAFRLMSLARGVSNVSSAKEAIPDQVEAARSLRMVEPPSKPQHEEPKAEQHAQPHVAYSPMDSADTDSESEEDPSTLQNSAADSTGGLAASLLARGRGLSSLFALK